MIHKKSALLVFRVGLAAVVFSSIATGGWAQEKKTENSNDVVRKLQEYYASIGDYEASFVQTSWHKMFPDRLDRAYGQLMFKKGGLMRWEYARPDKKYFVYDGKTLWIYEPEVPQVFSGDADADRLRKALAFLTGEGKILDYYKAKVLDAAALGFPQGTVVGLYPKEKGSSFKYVEIYIDRTANRVVRSVLVDREDNRNRLDFSGVKTNANLPAEAFQFTPPSGVPVISADKQ